MVASQDKAKAAPRFTRGGTLYSATMTISPPGACPGNQPQSQPGWDFSLPGARGVRGFAVLGEGSPSHEDWQSLSGPGLSIWAFPFVRRRFRFPQSSPLTGLLLEQSARPTRPQRQRKKMARRENALASDLLAILLGVCYCRCVALCPAAARAAPSPPDASSRSIMLRA